MTGTSRCLSPQFWNDLMGRDLPPAPVGALQPVTLEDGRFLCPAGHWAAEGGEPVEYAIGKGSRALLTRHLAQRERAHNITVNLINPGPGHTAHFGSLEEALAFSEHSGEWASRKGATPQDIADAVLFLCSEQARFITGSHIAFSVE